MKEILNNQSKLMRIIFGKECNISLNYQELQEVVWALQFRYKKLKKIDASPKYKKFIKDLQTNLEQILDQY